MKLTPIRDLCLRISSGGTPSRNRDEYFSGENHSGHLWVKSKELLDCSIASTEETITDEGLKKSAAKYFPAHTVLVAMYGANVGQLGWLANPATVNQAICGLVTDEAKADWRFLFYALLQERAKLITKAQGAAQQNLNQDAIRNFELPVPDLPTQRKIAGILSAYDDLIENNLRRIKILGEMAQSLYREWFVHFRFPGHESAKFVDSPLGRIPKGWEVTTYREAAIFENGDRGKNYPKAGEFVEKGIPFINAGHLVEGAVDLGSLNYISSAIFKRLRSGKILSGDILFCLRGSPGRTARVASLTQGSIASSLVIIRPTSRSDASWLYYTLSSDGGRRMVDELNNGAAQPNVSVGSIQNYPLLMPPKSILEQFAVFAEQNQKLEDNIRAKVSVLRANRDLLLPKLLSGAIFK